MKRFAIAALLFVVLLISGFAAWSWRADSPEPAVSQPIAQANKKPAAAPKPNPRPKVRPATAAERQSAIRSILGQLDAFRRDDYKTAIGYQSRGLQKSFPSRDAFRNMIRRFYPQFARYKTASFGAATIVGEGKNAVIAIPITLTGQDGVKVEATYILAKENGVYRVSGVNGGMKRDNSGKQNPPSVPPAYEGLGPLIT